MRQAPDHTMRSELLAFLCKNHYMVRGRAAAGVVLTHTLMDGRAGGRICLPDSAMTGFISAYGSDLAQGCKLYVIERRTPVFKMHFDLDLKTIHDDETAAAVLETLRQTVAEFLAPGLPKESWCVACAVLGDDGRRKAPGLHVVFPWLFVNSEQAKWIRSSVVSRLRAHLPDLENNWDEVVDIAVLTTNGLRMVGSDKCTDCPVCRNNRDARDFCPDCNRQGKVPENKIYWPWLAFPAEDARALRADVCGNPAYAVQMCSTRIPLDRQCPTPRFVVPTGAPPPSVLCRAGGPRDHRDHTLQELPPTRSRLRMERVDLTPDLRAALSATLATHHSAYASVDVSSLERLTSARRRDSFLVKVRGFGCRYCQNKRADHTQQTVYFLIMPSGISQRCYSRKSEMRHAGFCENYSSAPTPLAPQLAQLLFPDAAPRGIKRCANEGLVLAAEMWGAGRRMQA